MDYSISFAQKSDELSLKRLFLNCFDDTLGFVNMFFSHHFVPENTVCVYLDDKIIGQTHLLSCSVNGRQCFYIYGVCVDAEYRNKGIGKAMLEYICRECEKRGFSVLLHPQNEGLFDFYYKCGFSPCGFWKEETITPSGEPCDLTPIDAAEYKEIRDERFKNKNPLVWDEVSVEYALYQEAFFGFTAYKTEKGDIVLAGCEDGETYIKETTAEGDELIRVAAAVQKKLGGETVRVLLPGKETDTPCGFGVGAPANIYMNLLLD